MKMLSTWVVVWSYFRASAKEQRAHLHYVEVALVGLAKGVAAAGEAVEEDKAEGEDVDALALAHLLPAAAEQLLWRLPSAASACTANLTMGFFEIASPCLTCVDRMDSSCLGLIAMHCWRLQGLRAEA